MDRDVVDLRSDPTPAEIGWSDRLAAARARAIASGEPVTGVLDSVGRFTAYPSGLVLTDSAPRIHASPPFHAR